MASGRGGGSTKATTAAALAAGGRGVGMPEAEVEQVFRRYDANGDGKISAEELASMLRALGAPPEPGEVRRMMDEMDADHDGFVDLAEFIAFHCGDGAGGDQQEDATEAELREAFRLYDADQNGLISARELHRVLRQLGDKCSVADCSRMIRSVDADGDGSVNFEEFKKMMGTGAGRRSQSDTTTFRSRVPRSDPGTRRRWALK
ncbi:probable calcium-binding protein CML18 isoform X2 [Phragmites australis]|uniref:probable calcium-binding protein CML18 isoform X2 n=1 Tax=Phragmites australis TaxID=29695 RepID=UPI002D77B75F|nr:probable calcium-binding protein CML18 isoform X2 [Phragmites australis]